MTSRLSLRLKALRLPLSNYRYIDLQGDRRVTVNVTRFLFASKTRSRKNEEKITKNKNEQHEVQAD